SSQTLRQSINDGTHGQGGAIGTESYTTTGNKTLQWAHLVSPWDWVGISILAGSGGGQAPVITSTTSVTGTVGTAFSYTITATNTPTSFGETGTLPAGLTLNSATGAITGTPTATGTSTVTISATNATGTGTASLQITINTATPVITSATSATGTV